MPEALAGSSMRYCYRLVSGLKNMPTEMGALPPKWRQRDALRTAGAGENLPYEFLEAAWHSDSEPPIARALR